MNHAITATDGNRTWAWAGCRIAAAADLTEIVEFSALPEERRLVKVVSAETAWLNAQWDDTHASRIDLRYLSNPESRSLECAVLGGVVAQSPAEAHSAVRQLRERVAAVPRHVHVGSPLTAQELQHFLTPFRPAPHGLVELRKRVHAARPQRPDAGVGYYLAVQPFPVAAQSWEPLWTALVASPAPVLLSVCLEPLHLPPALVDQWWEVASQYGRLASPGRSNDGLYSYGATLTPDSFAVDAAKLYSDAARRYSDRAFRFRVSMASPAPLSEALTQLLGAIVAPPPESAHTSFLTSQMQGPSHGIVRPANQIEAELAWQNIATLACEPWASETHHGLPIPSSISLLSQIVDGVEASAVARLPSAVQGHTPGFPVRRPGSPFAADYQPQKEEITLGRQLVDGRLTSPIGIPLQHLTRHALIVGMPGSGKTNITLSLCEQLWRDHKIPFMVLEPVNTTLNDYRWLATRPGMDDLIILTVGNEALAPLRINPFEVPCGVRISTHIASLLACFDAAFGLWDPLPHIYRRALSDLYARAGLITTEISSQKHDGRWPSLPNFARSMRKCTAQLEYSGEARSNITAASLLRAESLAEGASSSTLNCDVSYPIDALLERPVIIELAEIGDNEKEQSLVIALILQMMTEFYKANRSTSELRHVTIIEEAHRLIGRTHGTPTGEHRDGNARERAAQAFANSLAENRKYGEGLVIVEQLPGKLVEDAFKNTNLQIMHRLAADDDRRFFGASISLTPDQQRLAAKLQPFTAFTYHDGLDRAALIGTPNVRSVPVASNESAAVPTIKETLIASRFAAFRVAVPKVDAALAPFLDCDGCRFRCNFRSRVESILDSEDIEEFKRVVEGIDPGFFPDNPWPNLTSWSASVASRGPLPNDPAYSEQSDFKTCIVVHAVRRSWRTGGLPLIQQFRRYQELCSPVQTEED